MIYNQSPRFNTLLDQLISQSERFQQAGKAGKEAINFIKTIERLPLLSSTLISMNEGLTSLMSGVLSQVTSDSSTTEISLSDLQNLLVNIRSRAIKEEKQEDFNLF